MKIINTLFVLLLFFYSGSSFAGLIHPSARITVKAMDVGGNFIPGAKVRIHFYVGKPAGKGWGLDTQIVEGRTDNQGSFTGSGDSINYCNISVEKNGFYDSICQYNFAKVSISRHWEPWDPIVNVFLKEKRNPTPMFAKKTGDMKIPIIDQPVGYDLEKGDWVMPYGKGVVNDFIFYFKTRYVRPNDWECSYKLTFSNISDGIQEYTPNKENRSQYIWPYEAPESGYKSELLWSASYSPNKGLSTDYKKDKLLIFRVRTKADEKGNIISSSYGKIKSDIELFANGIVRFEYYFNSTGTRNLEFANNLFKWTTREDKDEYDVRGP